MRFFVLFFDFFLTRMETAENKRFIYEFGKFVLDPQEKTLFSEGHPLRLPAKEFETLLILVENNGRALTKEEMMAAIWRDAFVEEANLAKQISRLRKIFNSNGEKFIETLPKHGYRFNAPINQILQPAGETLLEKRTVKKLTFKVEEEFDEAPKDLPQAVEKSRSYVFYAVSIVAVAALTLGYWFWNAGARSEKIDSIAVLPLRSLNGEESDKALGLGMADALIMKLGSFRTVAVRPTSSVARFTEIDADALEIGRKLNVDAVLEGTIRQSDGRIRINVRLLKVENGEQLWAEKFDGEKSGVFDLEDRLSERTARALGLKLGIGENGHLTRRFTSNTEAFEDYLKGRYFWNKRTEDGFRQAIGFFNSAVRKDPNYALAFSGLADCYILLGVWGAETPKEVFPQAKRFAEKALAGDPNLAEALVSRAFVEWVYEWDFRGADADFSRAIELNPNYATARHWRAYFLASQRRFDEALDEIKKARELEGPLNNSVSTDVGEIYLWAGKYAESEAVLRDVLKIEPNYAVARHVLAINLLKQNRFQEAVKEAETAYGLESKPLTLSVLAHAYAAAGEREKALKILGELSESAKRNYVSPFRMAVARTGLGETGAAIDELEKAFDERSDKMAILGVYPLLDRLRDNPRFIDLQRRIEPSPR